MKRIILSAFGRFGNYLANPTEIVAKRLFREDIASFTIYPTLFDAAIPNGNRGQDILQFAWDIGANGIISLGMASSAKGLQIERTAVNRIYDKKYCPSALNNMPVDRSRPYNEKLQLDLRPWNVDVFRSVCDSAGISTVGISDDAGAFCCNHLMYQMCVGQLASRAHAKIPFIFIHVPCCPESVPDRDAFVESGKITMGTEEIISGLTLLLKHASI